MKIKCFVNFVGSTNFKYPKELLIYHFVIIYYGSIVFIDYTT